MVTDVIEERVCLWCGHRWWPNKPGRPYICPRCKTALHDVPKTNGKSEPKPEQG